MRLWLLGDPSGRALRVAFLCSILLHLLAGVLIAVGGYWASPAIVRRGEPLFVDIAPDKPEERAPLGNPARPPGAERAPREPERRLAEPPAPKPAPPPTPPAPPKSAEAPKPAAPPQVARAASAPLPEAPAQREPEPSPREPRAAEPERPAPAPQASQAPKPEGQPSPVRPSEVSEPRLALSKPRLDPPPSIYRRPGGGGGLRGGRGGVEGEPVPLDTPDPKYQDYFSKLRRQIESKWIYPREAGERGIGGQLLIEFHIAKDGGLEYLELRRSSGVEILDDYAMNAVRLAQPFPPVPDALARQVLAVSGLFVYQIAPNSFVNQFLR